MKFTIKRVKIALIIFLAIYAILGIVSLVVWRYESYTLSSYMNENIKEVLGSENLINKIDPSWYAYNLLYNYFLVLGVIMLIYGIWGAVSVYSQNRTCLKVFGFLLLIIASMKVPIIVYSMFESNLDIVEYAKSDIWNNFQDSFENFRAESARNFIQVWHKCCGVNGYKDYVNYTERGFPKSCCYDNTEDCRIFNDVIQEGCIKKIGEYFEECFRAVGILSCFILILEIPATILAFHLPRLLKNKKRGKLERQCSQLYVQDS